MFYPWTMPLSSIEQSIICWSLSRSPSKRLYECWSI